MIRGIAVAAVAGAVCIALVAGSADAYTRAQALCVKAAKLKAKSTITAARTQSTSTYKGDLQMCFNDPDPVNGCVATCYRTHDTVCVPAAKAATADRQSLDDCQAGCKDLNDTSTCSSLCNLSVPGCTDQILKCVAQAQFGLFKCKQACLSCACTACDASCASTDSSVQQGLIDCDNAFGDCLQQCAN